VVPEPVYEYVPVPVIVGRPGFPRHHPHGHSRRRHRVPPPAPLTGPFTPNPARSPGGPTQMPFGASHMPFGASHMPFGASHMPFDSSLAR
jgi:hypothetical protein